MQSTQNETNLYSFTHIYLSRRFSEAHLEEIIIFVATANNQQMDL